MWQPCVHCGCREREPQGDYPAGSYRWICSNCGKRPWDNSVLKKIFPNAKIKIRALPKNYRALVLNEEF